MRFRTLVLAWAAGLCSGAHAAPMTEADRQAALQAHLAEQAEWYDTDRHAEHLALWRAAVRLQVDGEWLDAGARPDQVAPVAGGPQGAFRVVNQYGTTSVFALSPDGRTLVTDGPDESAVLWDAQHGWKIRQLQGRTSKFDREVIVSVVYAADGKTLATVAKDARVRLWDGTSGQLLHVLEADPHARPQVAFSPDGQTLAVASAHRGARLFSVAEGRPIGALEAYATEVDNPSDERPRWLLFSPDGAQLITAAFDGPVRVWDVDSGRFERFIGDRWTQTRAVALSANGARIATASRDGFVQVWDRKTGAPVRPAIPTDLQPIDLQFSPDGALLAMLSTYGFVVIEPTAGGRRHSVVGLEQPGTEDGIRLIRHMDISPDGQTLALAAEDSREVVLWDIAGQRIRQTLSGPSEHIAGVRVAPDGTQVVAALAYGGTALWDLRYPQMTPAAFLAATGRLTPWRVCRETMQVVQMDPPPPPTSVWVEDVPGVDHGRDGCTQGEDGAGRFARSLATTPDQRQASRAAAVTILGALDRSVIDAALSRHTGNLEGCYRKGLTDTTALEGAVTVRFVVAGDGSVLSSSTTRSTLENENIASCITEHIRRIQFPAPKTDGIVIVSYPVSFRLGSLHVEER